MPIIQHAVIAAAGFGSRLNKGIPKCLVEVNGHKIIEYQLALLRDIPDVRIVVGYHSEEVIKTVKHLRPDVQCILNERFESTSTLQSYYMGIHDFQDFFVLLDGDIIPHKSSFNRFLSTFSGESIVGVSPASTQDAVFVHTDSQGQIVSFTRTRQSAYEWSNIAVLHSQILKDEATYVYQCLEKNLPIRAEQIERLEIDTQADMDYALEMMRKTTEYSL